MLQINIRKFIEIKKINYICSIIKNKEVNMLIINYLNYKNEKMLLKKMPSNIAVPFYLLNSQRADVKIIITKKSF